MPDCAKCLLEEENIPATHHCPLCKVDLCESHLTLHNSSNKTKDHASQVKSLSNTTCAKCQKEEQVDIDATHQCIECDCKMCSLHAALHKGYPKYASHQVKQLGFTEVPFSGKFELVGTVGDQEEFVFEFSKPNGLFVDTKHKTLLVADSGKKTIFAFDLETRKLRYQFVAPYIPTQLCVDYNDDTILISSKEDSSVVKVSLDGQELFWKFGGGKSFEEDKLYEPQGICVDPVDSCVYVCCEKRICVISKDGKYLRAIGQNNGKGPVEFDFARGLDMDKDGNLLVTEVFGQRVRIISKKGAVVKLLNEAGKGSAQGQVNYPEHAIVEPCTGNIFVADSLNYRIQLIKPTGGVRCYGSGVESDKPGEFRSLSNLALSNLTGQLFVADPKRNCVQIFK